MRPQEDDNLDVPYVPTKQIFSVSQAAAHLGIAPHVVRRRIAEGHLMAYRWSHAYLLLRRDLEQTAS